MYDWLCFFKFDVICLALSCWVVCSYPPSRSYVSKTKMYVCQLKFANDYYTICFFPVLLCVLFVLVFCMYFIVVLESPPSPMVVSMFFTFLIYCTYILSAAILVACMCLLCIVFPLCVFFCLFAYVFLYVCVAVRCWSLPSPMSVRGVYHVLLCLLSCMMPNIWSTFAVLFVET